MNVVKAKVVIITWKQRKHKCSSSCQSSYHNLKTEETRMNVVMVKVNRIIWKQTEQTQMNVVMAKVVIIIWKQTEEIQMKVVNDKEVIITWK